MRGLSEALSEPLSESHFPLRVAGLLPLKTLEIESKMARQESGRLARIDSRESIRRNKPCFHNVRAIPANRLKPATHNFRPEMRFEKKGGSIWEPSGDSRAFCANRAI